MSESAHRETLARLCDEAHQAFVEQKTILSFNEYFSLLLQNPQQHLRSSAQYLVDMMDHFGREEQATPTGVFTRFKLFDAEFGDSRARVSGQESVHMALYRALANFAREGRTNKLLLLHGPNGSAKSSICRALMSGMEHYARAPEGAAYAFNWVFPSGADSNDHIGFGTGRRKNAGRSFAYLEGDQIDARIPCEMHDHPAFLIPQKQRSELLQQLLPEPEDGSCTHSDVQSQTVVSDYLRLGDLCYKCRKIYDSLLASYDGDTQKVLNHVQIERLYLSRRYRRSVATIEPQLSVDARIQQVTADRSLGALPKALRHTALYEPSGPLVDANRGLLEFSDLLKRPVDAFKYLLSTVETSTVSMDSFMLHLDMCYIASTNETYFDAFKEHPDFASFRGRLELIQVPYLARYRDEVRIYTDQITQRIVGKHVAPHSISVAAMWALLTRMRRNDPNRYEKSLNKIIRDLTPMQKLRLYDDGELPQALSAQEAQQLRAQIPALFAESRSYPNYEGRFGASAREIRSALLNAAHHPNFACLTPVAVFEQIRTILAGKSVYDFLRQEIVGAYHNHEAFLEQTESVYLNWIDRELREAMGLTDAQSYAELFERYVMHISHWIKQEKIHDPVSGTYHDPDARLMEEIEGVLLSSDESAEEFRRTLIGTIGALSLDLKEKAAGDAETDAAKIDYAEHFGDYIARLEEDFYSKRRDDLKKINQQFLRHLHQDEEGLEPKDKARMHNMMDRLHKNHGYCPHCASDAVDYLLKHRYN